MTAMVMTQTHTKGQGQRSLGSKVRSGNRRTDGRTEAIVLPPVLMRSVIIICSSNNRAACVPSISGFYLSFDTGSILDRFTHLFERTLITFSSNIMAASWVHLSAFIPCFASLRRRRRREIASAGLCLYARIIIYCKLYLLYYC